MLSLEIYIPDWRMSQGTLEGKIAADTSCGYNQRDITLDRICLVAVE